MTGTITRCSLALAVAVAVVGCSHGETRIHVTVTADPALNLDHYEFRVGVRSALADALPALDVEIPDDAAGEASAFEVWGLVGGQQVAFGMTTVTPTLHATVSITVALSAVDCGPWCTNGDIECMAGGTATCAVQSNGCLGWSVTACPADAPYCANGTCAAQCTDECAMGQTECDSAVTMRTCGPSATSTCLVWSAPMACTGGQTCSGQACATAAVCATDGAACDDGDACTQDDACEGGTCSGTPKCTTAPTNADPTCSNGTCGFTCHAGYMMSGSGCALDAPDGKVVFVTTETYDGKLGGLSGADADCQTAATGAGLTGTYKAWLSDSTTNAGNRLTPSTSPYVLVDGTVVANNWLGLVSGSLLHPISLDEHGALLSVHAFTFTGPDGDGNFLTNIGDLDCSDWTTNHGATSTMDYAHTAVFGQSDQMSALWTTDCSSSTSCQGDSCVGPDHLYCIEQ